MGLEGRRCRRDEDGAHGAARAAAPTPVVEAGASSDGKGSQEQVVKAAREDGFILDEQGGAHTGQGNSQVPHFICDIKSVEPGESCAAVQDISAFNRGNGAS